MDIVIDGYNLMHAAGLARPAYGPRGLQKARHQLILRVKLGFLPADLPKLLVVFDAKEAPAELPPVHLDHGITVQFALPGQEADELIEDLIQKHSVPRQLLIVSSDHRLQRAARRRNASFIDSDLFLDDLDRRARQFELERRREHRPAPSPERDPQQDLEHWLQEFGEIDLDEISRSVDRAPEPSPPKSPPAPAVPKSAPAQAPERAKTHPASRKSGKASPTSRPQGEPPHDEPSPLALPDEEAFWTQRIQELFDEENQT
jgi:predicted RNA-binding protein with PIN domain